MKAQSEQSGVGEQTVCKFDKEPIYFSGDEWLHYPNFKGDNLHYPEPLKAPAGSPGSPN